MVGREITAAFVNGKEMPPSKRMKWYAYLNWLGNDGRCQFTNPSAVFQAAQGS
jgi:hypothetical protein